MLINKSYDARLVVKSLYLQGPRPYNYSDRRPKAKI
jgi:hypothetical protein